MKFFRSLVQKMQGSRSLYLQLLFVTLAFTLMVVSSGIFVYKMLTNYLEREAINRLMQVQIRIEDELREQETLMIHIVKDVRDIIMGGGSADDVRKYYELIAIELIKKESGFVFDGLHGYFEALGDAFISVPEWTPPDDYDPTERRWYQDAVKTGDKIAISSVYMSQRTEVRVIDSVCRLFDDEGKPLGVVALCAKFSNIERFVTRMSVIEGGRGLLADENFYMLVHPGEGAIGTHMTEIAAGPTLFVKMMEQGKRFAKIEDYNYWDVFSIFYFTRLDNGWVLWLMTPKNIYYNDLKNLMMFLGVLAFTLMVAVNLILIRIDAVKRKTDERVQLMLDMAPFGVTLVGKNYQIIDCNRSALSMVGLTGRKDDYKQKFIELTAPLYQPNGEPSNILMRKYVDSVFEKQGEKFPWIYKNVNGEFIPNEITAFPIIYRGMEIAVAYSRDLREEIKIQEKERETQAAVARLQQAVEEKNRFAYFGSIMNGLDTMIYVTDPATDEILFVNNNMKRNYGIEGDVTGQICYKVLQKGLNEKCGFCPCFKLDKDPNVVIFWEERSTITNRIYRNVDRYIDWPNGKTAHLQHSTDINDLKSMADTLNAHLDRQLLMTHISQSFLSTENMDVLITEALRMTGEFMGIEQILMYTTDDNEASYVCRNEWINPELGFQSRIGGVFTMISTFQELFARIKEEQVPYVTSADPRIKTAFAPYRLNFQNYMLTFVFLGEELFAFIDFAREGEERPWEQDKINLACFVTNVLVGALNKRTAELQLIAAKESAEQSNRSKGVFLAHMSHEIRTPMNAILGASEIQLQDKNLPPDTEEAFRQIYDSGSLLLNIINDILDFSKIEAGKMEIIPSKYDIPSLLNDTVQLNLLRYESKPLEFKLDLDANTPLDLYGDELRIKQILNNLLSNAFKYTGKGEIKLSVSAKPMKNTEMVMLVFKVSDTGQGMSKEQVEKLFDEYSRFNMETNRGITGTGLGMSIVKRLVEMMGGEIFVESKIGKGSAFTVRLPQKNIGSAVCGAELADSLGNFRFHSVPVSKKAQIVREYMPYGSVLVVDDVSSNLYVAKGLLTPYGLRIETATSGTEAIEKIKDGKAYDIVFMDHMMPGIDGMEATEILRGMGYTRPIVALTANAVVGQSEIFLANGFDGFISKPIDLREMDAALNRFIRDKQPRELIEATRREQRERETENSARAVQEIKDMSEIYKYFVLDAENAIGVIEEVYEKLDTSGAKTVDSYVTAVHGMKNVLANIGEKDLSTAALKLEQAGKEQNYGVITEKTPGFIDALRSLIKKHRPANNDEAVEMSGEDTVYLRDKLLAIKTACEAFDTAAAKEALDNLRQKTWPRSINDVLDEISVHLLHSAFKKAATVAENTTKI